MVGKTERSMDATMCMKRNGSPQGGENWVCRQRVVLNVDSRSAQPDECATMRADGHALVASMQQLDGERGDVHIDTGRGAFVSAVTGAADDGVQ